MMTEPVCLGMCEHMLCRSCAGPQAGDGCVVCQSPAWVKDIHINRQLSSIIQLFCGLEFLLHPIEQPDSKKQTQPRSPVFKQKKNFKIWFSPRSRKVRCMVEKPSEVLVPESTSSREMAASQQDTCTAQCQDLSVFNFTSSSPDSGSSCSQKCKNEDRKKGSTKKNQHLAEGSRRSSKRVSFHSPAVTSDEPQPKVPQGSTNELSPGRSTMRKNLLEGSVAVLNEQTQLGQRILDSVGQHDKLSETDSPEKWDSVSVSPPKHSSKRSRVEEKAATLETTPKRPRASPGRRIKSQMSPAVLNPLSLASPRCDKSINNSRQEQGDSPSVRASVGRQSPCSPVASVGRPTSGSPAVTKRNHKGETLLHLAAIKGDVEAVKELLDQGADPNLKDNAGWTPLHEACNLGHLVIVEVLVSRGALLNTPGYENDSPLHDAVRNGHPAIVKLLLQFGMSFVCLRLPPVSHVVVPEGHIPTTNSTLLGLLAGCWVLPPLFDGCFFFLLGSFKTPSKDELTKLLREGGGQLLSRQPKPDSDVTQTLSAAAYHALPGSDQALCTQYIIFDPQAPHKPAVTRRGKVWSAPSTWLVHCISAFRLLPVSGYIQ
uniref:BRCA1 associated RING domain 1 n=1 Tax=Cyclopterus lumpus TaxID=8103 RepID=A0A8C3GBY5_CYCLU